MGKSTIVICVSLAALWALSAAGGGGPRFRGSRCDVRAYLHAPGREAVDARAFPGGRVVKPLPRESDPRCESGVYLTISLSKGGWLRLDSVECGDMVDTAYRGLWIEGRFAGVGTTNYDGSPLALRERADGASRVVAWLHAEQSVPVLACSGRWIYTEGKGAGGVKAAGWLSPEGQCSSAVTNCN